MTTSLEHVHWIQTWTDLNAGTFRIGRTERRLVAEWVGIAKLVADRCGREVEFRVAPGCDAGRAHKLQSSTAQALLGHLKGAVTLHASVVASGNCAVAFLGDSGSGKSTLAAALCRAERVELVADDTASLATTGECPYVTPTQSVNWLASDACELLGFAGTFAEKVPNPPRSVATEAKALRALVKLSFDEKSELRRLIGRDAFKVLHGSMFRFALDDPQATLRDFARLECLAAKVPVYELSRPKDLIHLSSTVAVIDGLLGALAQDDIAFARKGKPS